MSLLAVYRAPFSFEPVVRRMPEGLTLADLARRMEGLPDDFMARGVICVDGQPVPRALWHAVRPKSAVTEVTLHAPPQGGENGGKQILALVASVALLAVTSGIAAGGVRFLGVAGRSTAAYALAAGVSYVGSLLLSALTAPPTTKAAARTRDPGSASVEGNALQANGEIPRVIGERKVFPPFAAEPLTYFDGPDELVEAVVCLAGPHRLTDIRIGSAPVESLGIEWEAREGWSGDPALSLITRQSRTEAVQSEVRGHVTSDSNGARLDVSGGDLAAVLPQAVIVATREAPDEHQLQLVFAQGLHVNGSDTTKLRVPVRLRIRRIGDAPWINLPELHFQAAAVRQLRASIVLQWAVDAGAPSAAHGEGWVEARRISPGQVAAPASSDWVAHSHFGSGGDAWMSAANLGSTGVLSVFLDRYTARIALDPAVFPPGRYEVELMRGAVFNAADYDAAAYEVNGSIWDLFGYRGSPPAIARSRDGVADALYLLRSVSIWNAPPVQKPGLALIAVRARNRALDAISVVAGGWVRDWDGAAWRSWAVTDNPAPHLHDILAGDLNANPVPAEIMDDAALVAWRSDGWACNAVVEGLSVGEAAVLVAGCGYARPYMSEVYGVVRDRDRSSEAPVQVFTPRNSAGFQWTRAFPRIPDGLRVTYRDRDLDYDERQVVVARRDFVGEPILLEQVTYEGPVTEAEAVARARYDLDQGRYRATYYSLEAPAEAIICRKGDLVGVQHDALTEHQGSARVVQVAVDGGGNATALTLDCDVPVLNEPNLHAVTDLHGIADLHMVGLVSGLVLRGSSGPTAVLALSGASGETDTLTLAAPLTAGLAYVGALAVVGPAQRTVLRLVVTEIEPREDLTALLSMVDEGPEIWAA